MWSCCNTSLSPSVCHALITATAIKVKSKFATLLMVCYTKLFAEGCCSYFLLSNLDWTFKDEKVQLQRLKLLIKSNCDLTVRLIIVIIRI